MKNTSILIPIILIGCLTALGFLLYKAMQSVEEERPRSSRQIVLNQEDYTDEPAPADIGKTTDYDAQAGNTDSGIVPNPVDAAENEARTNSTTNEMREMTAAEKQKALEADRLEDERLARQAAAEREAAARQAERDRTEAVTTTARTNTATRSSARGQYLVIAGSFRQKLNAQQQVERLISAGFKETRLELFNGGTYAVALAEQTNRYSDAVKTAARIKKSGFDARVMRRR